MSDRACITTNWQRELGPYWSAREIAAALQTTVTRVRRLAEQRQLLVVCDVHGEWLFPTWAVDGGSTHTEVVGGLEEVLRALSASTSDPWLHACWLSGLLSKHRGWWAIEELMAGRRDVVLKRARNEDWSCFVA